VSVLKGMMEDGGETIANVGYRASQYDTIRYYHSIL